MTLPAMTGQRRLESEFGEDRLPVGPEDELHEGGRGLGIRCTGQRGDRVLGNHVEVLRDVDALDGALGRQDVRDVDDPGIELTGLHLGEQGPHVGLVRVDRGRDPGVVQCLASEVTARDVLGTQPDQ